MPDIDCIFRYDLSTNLLRLTIGNVSWGKRCSNLDQAIREARTLQLLSTKDFNVLNLALYTLEEDGGEGNLTLHFSVAEGYNTQRLQRVGLCPEN